MMVSSFFKLAAAIGAMAAGVVMALSMYGRIHCYRSHCYLWKLI